MPLTGAQSAHLVRRCTSGRTQDDPRPQHRPNFPPACFWGSGTLVQREIGRLAGTQSEFPKPFGFVLAVNDAALETERFSNVVTVVTNVLPGGLCVLPNPVLHIWRLAENVSGVPGLGHLNDHGLLQIENVFIPEDVHGPRTFVEKLVVV